jgi:hypothetical protein
MASGHVNRIKRPNTWLHRPMLQTVKKALAKPEPSTHGRFCCRSLLKQVEVGDSVAVERFATGVEHDGPAQPRSGTVFLFVSA